MKTTTFTPTPIAIAISTALLFGCSTEKASQSASTQEAPVTLKSEAFKDQTRSEVDRVRQDQKKLGKASELRERENAALYSRALNSPLLNSPALNMQTPMAVDSDVLAPKEEVQSIAAMSQPSPGRVQPEVKRKMAPEVSRDIAVGIMAPAPSAPLKLDYSEPVQPQDREKFAEFTDNPIKSTTADPLSTFGVDVDTASYALARQGLNNGHLPRAESVRTEEWLNTFSYDLPTPDSDSNPFSVTTEVAPAPWAEGKHLLSVNLKGYEVAKADLPPLNLTLLIDVSGSMGSQNKLPLAKAALKLLVNQLRPQDRVAITVYAGAAGLVLDSTPGDQKTTIISALDRLHSGGSTAGGAGIQLAYQTARQHHQAGAVSRVILLSDGDFNVGSTSTDALKKLVAQQRSSGVSLSVLTFGRGNIRDELMNSLAEIGNGNAAFIDGFAEAKKYLVDEMSGSMLTIAKDVKAQIEFNPAVVSEYRLMGYETRHLEHHDFNNDTKDAGEIGAGHAVTALYELTLKGSPAELTPSLRYDQTHDLTPNRLAYNHDDAELAFLKLRYKHPDADTSTLITQPIYRSSIQSTYQTASENFRWAAAVAGAAQKARGISHIGQWGYSDSLALAKTAMGQDKMGYRSEFVQLLSMAQSLDLPVQASRPSME
ncbi:MAG: von Willebrand factor type A domain-containing protein [Motiliproteus sp.]